MSQCECHNAGTNKAIAKKILYLALFLNLAMFIIGLIAGLLGQSTGLLADALDMLADASAYAIAILAIKRDITFKKNAARLSGILLLLLGFWILSDIVEKILYGSSPNSATMLIVASLSLLVNVTVLTMLKPFKNDEVHLRATWIFTRADIIVNIGVLISAGLVSLFRSRYPDLMIGFAVSLFVIKEATAIIKSSFHEK